MLLTKRNAELNPRQIRKNGFIPVTVYGKNISPSKSVQLNAHEYRSLALAHHIQLIDAEMEGMGKVSVIIKSREVHPLTGEILNLQFHAINPEDKVDVTVPLKYEGASPAVQAGGILFVNKKVVQLTCIAKNIPHSLTFNLNKLVPENPIAYYTDLDLPEGCSLKNTQKQIIIKVSMPQIAKT